MSPEICEGEVSGDVVFYKTISPTFGETQVIRDGSYVEKWGRKVMRTGDLKKIVRLVEFQGVRVVR